MTSKWKTPEDMTPAMRGAIRAIGIMLFGEPGMVRLASKWSG